jgi:diaminopropionate ammonia-lyase
VPPRPEHGLPLPWYANPPARSWSCPPPESTHAFHALLPDYTPSPLVEVPSLARDLGVGRALVKDESSRLGLPAFKALGASWAIHQILTGAGTDAARPAAGTSKDPAGPAAPGAPAGLAALGRLAAAWPGLVFVTATDGNHGRAVARIARLVGVPARIFLPSVATSEVMAAIAAEGADVTRAAGTYDDTVAAASRWAMARAGAVLVQDTAWPGYEQIPAWIVAGYSTLFAEIDDQLRQAGAGPAGLVAIPVGVGSLAHAAVAHYRSRQAAQSAARARPAALLAVEPDTAACALASLRAGQPVPVPTAGTIMAGLNCGTVSSIAWPYLAAGLDAAVAVTDAMARQAMRDLAAGGISSGPSGAAALAGTRAVLTGPGSPQRRDSLAIGPAATVVLLSTEAGRGRWRA